MSVDAPDLEEVEAHLAAKSPEERFELTRRLDTEATDIVAALLDAGAPLGLVDDRPMLHFAVFHAWRQQGVETLALLLEHGAPINERDGEGCAPLHWAAKIGSFPSVSNAVAQLLLARGAEVDARDEDGRTPLRIAVKTIAEGTVRALIDAGADVDAVDGEGESILDASSLLKSSRRS